MSKWWKFKQVPIQLSCGSERASSAISAVMRLRAARSLTPPSSQDDMPADLADSLKADEEDRKTDHAPLVQVKANLPL